LRTINPTHKNHSDCDVGRVKQKLIKTKGMLRAKKVPAHVTQYIIRTTLPRLIRDCHVMAVCDKTPCVLVCYRFLKGIPYHCLWGRNY
jgi:hypothetical protein